MKQKFILIILVIFIQGLSAWSWLKDFGGSALDWAWSVCADPAGNAYITGSFQGEANFGNFQLNGGESSNFFLAKTDPAGEVLWTVSGNSPNEFIGMSMDYMSGYVYVTGYFIDSLTIGEYSAVSHGGWDVFLMKCSELGEIEEFRTFGGIASEIGYGLSASNDQVYLTGWYNGPITLDNQYITNTGGSDIFVFTFNVDLELVSAITGNGPGVNYGFCVESNDNFIFTGGTSGGSLFFNNTEVDSSSGSFVYKKSLQSDNQLYKVIKNAGLINMSCDENNNLYITGRAAEVSVFDEISIPTLGQSDAYMAKFNENNQWEWVIPVGGNGIDAGKGIGTYQNLVAFTGCFSDTIEVETSQLISHGSENLFLMIYNQITDHIQLLGGYSNGQVKPTCLYVNEQGYAFVTGWYSGDASFSENTISSGNEFNWNVFLAKINLNTNENNDPVACSSSFSVYPNPLTSNRLTVRSKTGEDLNVSLYNIKGQKLAYQKLRNNTEPVFTLPESIAKGIYLLRIDTKNKSELKKIVYIK